MSLAREIQKDRGQPAVVRVGIVTSIAPLVIMLQDTALDSSSVGVMHPYLPAVDDAVILLGQSAVSSSGSSWLALGTASRATGNLVNHAASPTVNGSTASAVFSNYADNPTVTLTKALDSSRLLIRWAPSYFTNDASTGPEFGVSINGTDSVTHRVPGALTANVRLTSYGEILVSGVAAGVVTVIGRWRRFSGAGTIAAVLGADWSSLTVEER